MKLTIGMKGFECKKFLCGFCEKCKTSYYLDYFEKDENVSTRSQTAFEVRFLE